MIAPVYQYRATLDRVVDGDTYILRIDVGFRASVALPIRVRGLNTPEVRGITRDDGLAAKAAAESFLLNAQTIVVVTYKDARSFERWIADVYLDGVSMAERLIAGGFGVAYP